MSLFTFHVPGVSISIKIEHVDIHYPPGDTAEKLDAILTNTETIMADQAAQLAILQGISAGLTTVSSTLTDVGTQLAKGFDEVVAEIDALKAAAGGNSSPEMDALFTSIGDKMTALTATTDALQKVTQKLDDLNPDVPTP